MNRLKVFKMTKKCKIAIISTISVILALVIVYFILACVFVYNETYSQNEEMGFFGKATHSMTDVISGPPSFIWRKVVYNVTGSVSAENVKSGEDGFLFPVKNDSFDYRSDFLGEYTYTDEQYKKIADNLGKIRSVYEKNGADYYLYIIPNSQSVYDSLAPFGKTISENTRANGLVRYLKDNSEIYANILSDELKGVESDKILYHNTANELNDVGAYYICESIKSEMPNDIKKNSLEVDISKLEVLMTESDGRELTSCIALEKTVKNNTYNVDTSSLEKRYTTKENDGITVTSLKASQGVSGTSSVLLQVPSQAERSMLKSYFASTYTDLTVTPDLFLYDLSKSVSAVVQVIREDEIDILLDDAVAASYDGGGESGDETKKPTVYTAMSVERGTTVIFGTAEDGAVIEAKSGNNISSTVCYDGLFIVSVENSSKGISITAKKEGKSVSSPVSVNTSNVLAQSDNVIVGTGSRLYYTETIRDFTKQNTFSDKQLIYLQRQLNIQLSEIRKFTGKDTEMIILCAPNPATVYGKYELPEDIISRVSKKNTSRLELFTSKMSELDGITAIDISDIMIQNKDSGKLYYQTDTHWTELGAYYGYRAIMEKIAENHPLAAPYALDDFRIRYNEDIGGDLAGFLDIDKRIKENVPHLVLKEESKINESYDKPDTISRPEGVEDIVFTIDNAELPSAYMIRDSYAMQLIPQIGEHFSKLYAEEMWNYEIDYKALRELKPDYVIYVIAERNIGPVFMK